MYKLLIYSSDSKGEYWQLAVKKTYRNKRNANFAFLHEIECDIKSRINTKIELYEYDKKIGEFLFVMVEDRKPAQPLPPWPAY